MQDTTRKSKQITRIVEMTFYVSVTGYEDEGMDVIDSAMMAIPQHTDIFRGAQGGVSIKYFKGKKPRAEVVS